MQPEPAAAELDFAPAPPPAAEEEFDPEERPADTIPAAMSEPLETEGEPASVCAAAAQQGVNVLMKDSGFGPDRVGCP